MCTRTGDVTYLQFTFSYLQSIFLQSIENRISIALFVVSECVLESGARVQRGRVAADGPDRSQAGPSERGRHGGPAPSAGAARLRPQHDGAEKRCDATTAMARPSAAASSAAFNSSPHPSFLKPESAATGPASHPVMWDRVLHPMVRRLVLTGTSRGNPAFYTGTFQSQVCGISGG